MPDNLSSGASAGSGNARWSQVVLLSGECCPNAVTASRPWPTTEKRAKPSR